MRKSQDLWVATSPSEMIIRLKEQPDWNVVRKNPHYGASYIDCTATLDIETYNTADRGYLYTVQFNIRGCNCLLRYVEDFIEFNEKIIQKLELSEECRLVYYVHNLGYEMQYLIQVLNEKWGVPEILLTDSHHALYIRWENGIELRDSLKLFQKSLASATKGMPHGKLQGNLDYNKFKTPDTPLSPDEWNYCVNDVQGLYEAIELFKNERKYNQATIPLTNTGAVIAEVNRKIRGDGECIKAFKDLRLSKEQMWLAYHCMSGGDTHGTRWRSGITYMNCNSYDLKSAHPSQQILEDFPYGVPINIGECNRGQLEGLIAMHYGWIAEVAITDLLIKPECPDPTISVSKCVLINDTIGEDNGRLLGAEGVVLYLDSNDYQRLKQAYTFTSIQAMQCVAFELRPLPTLFRSAILDFFTIKESANDGPDRNFAKICVNTIFGACAQKTIRDEYELDFETYETTHLDWESNLLNKEYSEVMKSQKNKFPFLWGLWTSSLSRLKLWNLIKTVGWERVIYWDTDSCKYLGDKVLEVENVYNKEVRDKCRERGAVVKNRDGVEVYIGSAEDEYPSVEYGYKRFRFLHAKCYCAEAWNKKACQYELTSTIAGVGKQEGVKALQELHLKYGNKLDSPVELLRDGTYIAKAGGMKLAYHNVEPYTYTGFRRPTRLAGYIVMSDRDYLISHNPDPNMIFENYCE